MAHKDDQSPEAVALVFEVRVHYESERDFSWNLAAVHEYRCETSEQAHAFCFDTEAHGS